VATGGDKAPADESYRRKRIDRGKLAMVSRRTIWPAARGCNVLVGSARQSDRLTQECRSDQAVQRRRRIAQDGAGETRASCGSASSRRGQDSSSAVSSPSSVLPATRKRRPSALVRRMRVASASEAARTSNLRLPATETRSEVQPMARRRSASVSLCARTAESRLRKGRQRRRSLR